MPQKDNVKILCHCRQSKKHKLALNFVTYKNTDTLRLYKKMHQILKKAVYLAPVVLVLGILVYLNNLELLNAIIIFFAAFLAVLMVPSRITIPGSSSELSMEEQPTLFVNIMENLTDPLLFLSKNETILLANKSASEMFGGDIVNKKISDVLFDTEALSAIEKAIETGLSETIEFSIPNPRPKSYLLRIHVHQKSGVNLGEDGRNNRTLLLTIYDITSIREAERMRVDFVANVSHELRTPLASILGFVETLQGPAKDDPQAMMRFLKIMQDEASRMLRLIEDLLSLSHIERDAHIPPDEKVSVNKIIDSVIETLNIRLSERTMTTSFNSEDNANTIIGDRDQLTQVFQNLIDNAIKYGAENSNIEIDIKTQWDEEANNNYLVVSVKNEGAGIAPEHIARLTERFYRVDTARSRSLGGTGLGLAIVKHIIQRHEGKLSFESKVGEYTVAIIRLPMLP